MDRNRDARRAAMAAPNGLSRRRHRSSSLRDSPGSTLARSKPSLQYPAVGFFIGFNGFSSFLVLQRTMVRWSYKRRRGSEIGRRIEIEIGIERETETGTETAIGIGWAGARGEEVRDWCTEAIEKMAAMTVRRRVWTTKMKTRTTTAVEALVWAVGRFGCFRPTHHQRHLFRRRCWITGKASHRWIIWVVTTSIFDRTRRWRSPMRWLVCPYREKHGQVERKMKWFNGKKRSSKSSEMNGFWDSDVYFFCRFSASTKRSHEWPSSCGVVGGDQIHRQASTSPVRPATSSMAAPSPSSPSSSHASAVRKKLVGLQFHQFDLFLCSVYLWTFHF